MGLPGNTIEAVKKGIEALIEKEKPSDQKSLLQYTEKTAVPPGSGDKETEISPYFSLWFTPTDIAAEKWNQFFPYQLKIVREAGLNGFLPTQWTFTLPISPQDLSLSMPIAIDLQTTLGGRPVEQHAGAPFRIISFSGTTGVAPFRKNGTVAGGPITGNPVADAILGGTGVGSIVTATGAAVQKVITAAQTFLDGQPPRSANLHLANPTGLSTDKNNPDGIHDQSTGYYQFHLLHRFIENYVKMKTRRQNRDLRLVFCMWKDDQMYLVTPMRFDMRRSADRPMEYVYNIQLKAFARIDHVGSAQAFPPHRPATRDQGVMGAVMEDLDNATRLLQAVAGVATAVNADFNRILDIGRKALNVAKAAAGATQSFADMPESFKSTWKKFQRDSRESREQISSTFNNLGRGDKAAIGRNQANVGGSIPGDNGPDPDAIDAKFDNYEEASKVSLAQIPLTAELRKMAHTERESALSTSRSALEEMRDEVREISADYADQIGMGSDTYNRVYGRKSQAVSGRTPTSDELRALWAMQGLSSSLDRLSASRAIDEDKTPTTMEYVAGLAETSGITFEIPTSKFAVPVPYGITIEQIARLYLGDPNRWHELVALNHLRAPYIDEEGFELALVTNGNDKSVVVTSAENLYLGQTVWLYSKQKSKAKRHITQITEVSANFVIVELDGSSAGYNVTHEAKMITFLPGTVNSQMLMFIPSSAPTSKDFQAKPVPGVEDFDGFLKLGGIDLLLTPKGDVVIGPDGDFRLSYGLTNIVQTARLIITTPRGSLLQHPDFGLGLVPGVSTADIDATAIFQSIEQTFQSDPMFAGITGASLQKAGPVTRLSIAVNVRGSSNAVPIALDIEG